MIYLHRLIDYICQKNIYVSISQITNLFNSPIKSNKVYLIMNNQNELIFNIILKEGFIDIKYSLILNNANDENKE